MSKNTILIGNKGPRITTTNYWGSSLEAAGIFYVSVNAGAIRLLVPRGFEDEVEEMKTAKQVVVSRGMDTQNGNKDSLEILFDDHSDDPFVIFSPIEACDRPFTEEGPLTEFTVWTLKNGFPKCRITRRGVYRKVDFLPCMDPACSSSRGDEFHSNPSVNASEPIDIEPEVPKNPSEPIGESGLIHVTLNTGHVSYSPAIDLETGRLLQPLIATGGGAIPTREPWHVAITAVPNAGWIFDIQRGPAAMSPKVVRCALGFGPEASRLWQEMEKQHSIFFGTGRFVEMPTTQPWLAVLLLPEFVDYFAEGYWMGAFEHCMASALLEYRDKSNPNSHNQKQ